VAGGQPRHVDGLRVVGDHPLHELDVRHGDSLTGGISILAGPLIPASRTLSWAWANASDETGEQQGRKGEAAAAHLRSRQTP